MNGKIVLIGLAGGAAYLLMSKTKGNVGVISKIAPNVEFAGFSFSVSGGKINSIVKVKVTNTSTDTLTINSLKAYIQANGSTVATVEPTADQLSKMKVLPEAQTTIPIPISIALGSGILAAANLSSIKSLNVNGIIKIEGFPDVTLDNYAVAFDGAALVETVKKEAGNAIETVKSTVDKASNAVNDGRLFIVKSALDKYKKENPTDTVEVRVDENFFSQTLNDYYLYIKKPDVGQLKGSYVAFKIGIFGGLDQATASEVTGFKKITV